MVDKRGLNASMITVKQYAEERGITIQAVHKSMNGKRKAERLINHVEIRDGVKWLDDEAVAILDESRNKSPVVIINENKNEKIAELEAENKELRERILIREAELQNEIAKLNQEAKELYQEKYENAALLAKADMNQLLLQEKTEKLENLETALKLEQEKTESLQAELESEKRRSWWDKLWKK